MRHWPMQVVAEHLFHEGKFSVGEEFIQEAGIPQGEALRKPYEAMHNVLQEVLQIPMCATARQIRMVS